MFIQGLSKIEMYEFWNKYIKEKYTYKTKLCCKDTSKFFMHIKTDHFFKDIKDNAKKIFGTCNYEISRPLLMGNNKKSLRYEKTTIKIASKLAKWKDKTKTAIFNIQNKRMNNLWSKTKITIKIQKWYTSLINNQI